MMLGVIRYAPPTFPPYSILTTVKNANILIPTISVGGGLNPQECAHAGRKHTECK